MALVRNARYAIKEGVFEICPSVALVKPGGCPGVAQFSPVQHYHAIAELGDVGERMGGEKHRFAAVAEGAQLVLEQGARLGVEPPGGLVEHV